MYNNSFVTNFRQKDWARKIVVVCRFSRLECISQNKFRINILTIC